MITSINVKSISPIDLPGGVEISLEVSPKLLERTGFVFPITLQTPSFLCGPPFMKRHRVITVVALLDTGATRTCISGFIADVLDLNPYVL